MSATAPRQPMPIASSRYRLADSWVVITVSVGENGPMPLFTTVSDELCAVAYTDPDEARSDAPEGAGVFQIRVADFLGQLPPTCGLVVDPRAASPVFVAPDERQLVFDAAMPFPSGAVVRIEQAPDLPSPLLAALGAELAAGPAARRAYATRYQVADARVKLLVALDVDFQDPEAAQAAVDAGHRALRRLAYTEPAEIVALHTIPETFRQMILADLAPFYVRADLREPRG